MSFFKMEKLKSACTDRLLIVCSLFFAFFQVLKLSIKTNIRGKTNSWRLGFSLSFHTFFQMAWYMYVLSLIFSKGQNICGWSSQNQPNQRFFIDNNSESDNNCFRHCTCTYIYIYRYIWQNILAVSFENVHSVMLGQQKMISLQIYEDWLVLAGAS